MVSTIILSGAYLNVSRTRRLLIIDFDRQKPRPPEQFQNYSPTSYVLACYLLPPCFNLISHIPNLVKCLMKLPVEVNPDHPPLLRTCKFRMVNELKVMNSDEDPTQLNQSESGARTWTTKTMDEHVCSFLVLIAVSSM